MPTTCQWPTYSGETLVFPYAVLAPGLVGYYQVAMIAPPPSPSWRGCGFDSFGGGFPFFPSIEGLTKMRFLTTVLFALFTSWTASGQTYGISTFAGGGLPTNIPGTSASASAQ